MVHRPETVEEYRIRTGLSQPPPPPDPAAQERAKRQEREKERFQAQLQARHTQRELDRARLENECQGLVSLIRTVQGQIEEDLDEVLKADNPFDPERQRVLFTHYRTLVETRGVW